MSRHFPAFESPEPALNQAVVWAAGKLGGHLRAEPARSASASWDESDTEALIDDARLWHRVRTDRVIDPQEFLERVVGGLWGARLDGAGSRLEIAPSVPPGWRSMALRRLRAYRTLLDIELKARVEWLTVRVSVMFGPPIAVLIRLPTGEPVTQVTIDEVPVGGTQAIFTAQDEHEVTLFR